MDEGYLQEKAVGDGVLMGEIIKVGSKLEIRPHNASSERNNNRIAKSKVISLSDDGTIDIEVPVENGRQYYPDESFVHEMDIKCEEGIYSCRFRILEYVNYAKVCYYKICVVSDLRKKQRRRYIRLDSQLPMLFYTMTKEEIQLRDRLYSKDYRSDEERIQILDRIDQTPYDKYRGTVTNLSPGGIRFVSSVKLEKGNEIYAEINLSEGEEKDACFLRALIENPGTPGQSGCEFEYRAGFVNADSAVQEKIVKYIFGISKNDK